VEPVDEVRVPMEYQINYKPYTPCRELDAALFF
jgi:hypothetical protein